MFHSVSTEFRVQILSLSGYTFFGGILERFTWWLEDGRPLAVIVHRHNMARQADLDSSNLRPFRPQFDATYGRDSW
jgi:hypothetical protein